MIVNKNLYKFAEILLYLMPFFLITGSFLSDFSLISICLIFLYLTIKEKDFFYFYNKAFIFFLVFYFYLILNNLINFYNYENLFKSIAYLRFGIFFCAVFYFFDKITNISKNFFTSTLICFVVLIIDGYFQYFVGYNIFGLKISDIGRVSSFFGKELILGSYISRLYPILFGLFIILNQKSKRNFSLFSIIFIFAEALVFLSGERSAFFYMNLSAIFVILLIKNYKLVRFLILFFSLILILLISLNNNVAKKRIFDKTFSQIGINPVTQFSKENKDSNRKNQKKRSQKTYIFSKQHNDHYLSAYKMYKENKLFGIGFRNFRYFCNDEKYKVSNLSCSTHPHNTYIQLLSELGLIGFLFIFFGLIYFCYFSLKHLLFLFKNKIIFTDFQICLLSAILITIWPIIPTGNFFNNWLSIIFYLPVGLFLWSKKNEI